MLEMFYEWGQNPKDIFLWATVLILLMAWFGSDWEE